LATKKTVKESDITRKGINTSKAGVSTSSNVLDQTKVVTVAITTVTVRATNEEKLAKHERRVAFSFDSVITLPKVRRPDNRMTIIKPTGIRIIVLLNTGVAVANPETTRTSIKTARAVEQ
jgi:hypothetical protein